MDKKERFIEWLNVKHVNFSISSYIDNLERVSEYALKHGLSKDDVWHIDDFRLYNKLRSGISSDRIFKSQNGECFNIFEKYGKLYSDFLKFGIANDVVKFDEFIVAGNNREDEYVDSYENTYDGGDSGVLIVDFNNIDSSRIAFSAPVSLTYNGNVYDVEKWNEVYVQLLQHIYRDSPDAIDRLNGKSIIEANRIDISTSSVGMRAPKQIDGSSYFVETKLGAVAICQHIAALLRACGISYDSVIVKYTRGDIATTYDEEIFEEAIDGDEKLYRSTWSIYEAAIMLDGYISSLNGQKTDEICRRVSEQLRQMAINDGHQIDEIYRNFAGIKLHMYTMKTIYNGDPNARQSALFSEIVRLYREERDKYNEILTTAYKLCEADGLYGVTDSFIIEQESSEDRTNKKRRRSTDKEMLDATERILRKNEDGVTREQIKEGLCDVYSTSALDEALVYCHSVKVLDKYYHKDNIDGYSEMADIMLNAILRQFTCNGGFISATMLYKSVKTSLADFFYYNNSDFDSWMGVYDLCVHLFKQEKYKGYSFVFQDHINCIWREEPEYEKTYYGLLLKHVKDNSGKFKSKDAIDYLDEIGCKSSQSTLCRALSNSQHKDFVQYGADCFILAEAIKMDECFCTILKAQIESLLRVGDDSKDYVTFGGIEDYFYTTLPALPGGIEWNAYSVRSVLNIHDLGYVVLDMDEEANRRDLPSAILRKESRLKTLSDIIWAEMDLAFPLPKTMKFCEFRLFLIDCGFICEGERALSIRKTVKDDARFYWTKNDDEVIISA